jgi:hypothetical protein
MNNYVLAALLVLVPFGLALIFMHRKASPRPNADFSADQCLVLSLDKYQPMGRLLGEDDFRFLAAQPGFSKEMGRRFRAERRQIFRGYLRNLKKDFGRLSLALQILIVHSAEDRGDLASSLIRQRLLFALGMLAVEGRLVLHAAGVGTVDVGGLLQSLQTMQDQMRLLLTPPEAGMVSV